LKTLEHAPLIKIEGLECPIGEAHIYNLNGDNKLRVAFWNLSSSKGTIFLQSGRTEFIEKYYEVISEFIDNDVELNDDGNLTFSQVIKLCDDDNKKRILHKLLINEFKDNEIRLISKDPDNDESEKLFISPWTIPGFDFTNLINQYCIFNMIINGKKSKKNNIDTINISESNSLDLVNWDIFNSSISKNLEILFNKFVIDKLNEFKYKVNQYKSNMINIKKVRKAEKLLGNIYSGFILSVPTYGFFVEISELNVEGLVHVSTLNNDWYEYRSRQNLLIGRKSKKSYKVGDAIEVKIIKVDILKYQIDLELT